jgi:hypothetical protein
MYELIKNITTNNKINFMYGSKDFQNLYDSDSMIGDDFDASDFDFGDFDTGQIRPVLFLDPIQITENSGEYNIVESTIYEGSFMLVLSSDIGEEDYNSRYEKYIKPMVNTYIKLIKEDIICNGNFLINTWRMVEVINAFDFNGDGIIVTYKLTK